MRALRSAVPVIFVLACGGETKPAPVAVPPPESSTPTPPPTASETPKVEAAPNPSAAPSTSPSASSASPASASASASASPSTPWGASAGARTRSPTLRQGATQVNGRLPPEVIQRVVRQNFGRFRICYEKGLVKVPELQGRITTKFVIDKAGKVSTASDGGSDLPDAAVVKCVIDAFANLQFPKPESGIVTVVYPIIFSPGD